MHRFFSLCPRAAALLLLVAAACAHADGTLERIRERGVVTIGHRETSIPLSYVAEGLPMGYSVDVCRHVAEAIAKELALKTWRIAYKAVTSANRFDSVERGDIDLECGSTTNTTARRERVAFTIPHFIASSRLMVRSDRPFERIEDLAGRSVASTTGSTNIESLAREAKLKTIALRIDASRDHAEGVGWVLSGRVDAFAMDDVLLYGLRAASSTPSDLKIIGKPITIEPYAIAFERGNPALKRIVDAELRRLIATRELHRLYDKWFMQPIPPKGMRLDMRMPHLLVDSLKYPTDYVPN